MQIPFVRRLRSVDIREAMRFRGTRTSPASPARSVPLAERLKALNPTAADCLPAFGLSFALCLRGADLAAGSPEPGKKAQELIQRFQLAGYTTVASLVRWAFSLGEYPEWEAESNDLLYSLLIEPFAMMGCLPEGGSLNPPPEDDLPF